MDKYDPKKEVALAVDEWGSWYAQLPGTTPGFLAQQNSVRDALIAALNINIFARHAERVRMSETPARLNVTHHKDIAIVEFMRMAAER